MDTEHQEFNKTKKKKVMDGYITYGNRKSNRMLNHDLSSCSLGLSTFLIYCMGLVFWWRFDLHRYVVSCDTYQSAQLTSPKLFPWSYDFQSSSKAPHLQCFGHTFLQQLAHCAYLHLEWAISENITASELMMYTRGPGDIVEASKPNPGPFHSVLYPSVLQTYAIWPRGFHAHVLQDPCNFRGPRCWTSWMLEKIHPCSIPVPFFFPFQTLFKRPKQNLLRWCKTEATVPKSTVLHCVCEARMSWNEISPALYTSTEMITLVQCTE